jgi:hypothetical protein
MTFLAKDPDEEARYLFKNMDNSYTLKFSNNIFSYDLVEDSDYFYLTTEPSSAGNIGVLRIKKVGFVFIPGPFQMES